MCVIIIICYRLVIVIASVHAVFKGHGILMSLKWIDKIATYVVPCSIRPIVVDYGCATPPWTTIKNVVVMMVATSTAIATTLTATMTTVATTTVSLATVTAINIPFEALYRCSEIVNQGKET